MSRCRVRETVGLLTDGVDGEILIVGKILESLINFWVKILINKAINVLRRSGLGWSRRIRGVRVILLRGKRSIWIDLGLWRNGWLVEELLIVLWIWGRKAATEGEGLLLQVALSRWLRLREVILGSI